MDVARRLPAGDGIVEALTFRATLLTLAGRLAEARADLGGAWCEDTPAPVRARFHVARAMLDLTQGDLSAARGALEDATRAAAEGADARTRGEVLLLVSDLHLAEGERVAFRSHQDELVLREKDEQVLGHLMVGHVEVRLRSRLEASVMNVAGDAHDRHRPEAVGRVFHEELKAHGVAVREALAREGFAHDRDRRLPDSVPGLERAPSYQRNSHGREELRCHHPVESRRKVVLRGRRPVRYLVVRRRESAVERKLVRRRDGLDPGQLEERCFDLLVEATDLQIVGIIRTRE